MKKANIGVAVGITAGMSCLLVLAAWFKPQALDATMLIGSLLPAGIGVWLALSSMSPSKSCRCGAATAECSAPRAQN